MSITSLNIAQSAANLLSLEAKVAMVTGAASGIGRGIALRLAEMGAFVAVLDLDDAGSARTETAIRNKGGEAFAIRCDVSNAKDCRQATENVVQRRGKVDILSNCAGIIVRKDVLDLSDEEWDRTLDVTLKGVYLLSREVIPHMIRRGGGSIINIGSGWSLKAGPRAASYCAAKAGTVNLTRDGHRSWPAQHPRQLRLSGRCRYTHAAQRMRPAGRRYREVHDGSGESSASSSGDAGRHRERGFVSRLPDVELDHRCCTGR